jgi:hypothetical protein
MRASAVPLIAVLALAGCAGATGNSEVYPEPRLQHPHVTRTCPDVPAQHFDGSTSGKVTIYRCTAELLPADDRGVIELEHWVDRLVGDPAALLAAYAVADERPYDGACTLQFEDPLVIWVRDDDGTVPYYAPNDGCGFPTDAARAALESADFDRILVATMIPEE